MKIPKSLFCALILSFLFSCSVNNKTKFEFYKVKKRNFKIIIPAFGELSALKATSIYVPGNLRGPQIISWIIPENTKVRKNDLIVKLSDVLYIERINRIKYYIKKTDFVIIKKKLELEKERTELQYNLGIIILEKKNADKYKKKDFILYSNNQMIDDSVNIDLLNKKIKHLLNKKKTLKKKMRMELALLTSKKQQYMFLLMNLKAAMKSLEIRAPHDGLFIYEKKWNGEKPRVGKKIWSGSKIGELPDLNNMQAKLYVLEREALGITKGLRVSVTLDSLPEKKYYGKITNNIKIAKEIGNNYFSRYFEINVKLDKTDTKIMKPGSQVRASIMVSDKKKVMSVPNQSIFFNKAKPFLYIYDGSGIKIRKVRTGERSLTRTIITDGIKEGERVILNKIN